VGEGYQGTGAGVDPIRVLIADDHAMFRRGLAMVLKEVAPSAKISNLSKMEGQR
jgi:DNA-binding NarL/FixJ family response regulator